MPDTDAPALYAAEAMCPRGAQLHSRAAVAAYVHSVTESDWWRERGWPPVSVRFTSPKLRPVRAFGGYRSGSGFFVRFPDFAPGEERWAWCEQVIVHELAHVATIAGGDCGHGIAFRARYAELTGAVLGAVAQAALTLACSVEGLSVPRLPSPEGTAIGWIALERIGRRAHSGPNEREASVLDPGVLVN